MAGAPVATILPQGQNQQTAQPVRAPLTTSLRNTDTAIAAEEQSYEVEAMAMNLLDVRKTRHKGRKHWRAHDMRLKEIIHRAAMSMENGGDTDEVFKQGGEASEAVKKAQEAFRPQEQEQQREQE